MKKAGNFFKSIVPLLIAIVTQLIITIPMMIVYGVKAMNENGGDLDSLMSSLMSISTDQNFLQSVNIVYGIAALILFCLWYQKVFVKPFRKRRRNYPTGFGFHTIAAIIFLAVGLQYVTTLVVNLISLFRPAWISQYNTLMETAGYGDASIMLILYSVVIAPIVEEVIFRGLTFRYARHAMTFWAANLWQALLFGVMHMNLVQGIYAFTIGLFLGWVCHRGHGIKYSIPIHIVFNILGCFYSDLIAFTTTISFPVFTGLGVALTIFGMWLFYTDFQMEPKE